MPPMVSPSKRSQLLPNSCSIPGERDLRPLASPAAGLPASAWSSPTISVAGWRNPILSFGKNRLAKAVRSRYFRQMFTDKFLPAGPDRRGTHERALRDRMDRRDVESGQGLHENHIRM